MHAPIYVYVGIYPCILPYRWLSVPYGDKSRDCLGGQRLVIDEMNRGIGGGKKGGKGERGRMGSQGRRSSLAGDEVNSLKVTRTKP